VTAADPIGAALAWAAGLGALGAIVGSFIAALAVRWPEGRSVVRGRSACDACGATLRARDLVPLLSAWALHGRCRACAAPIAPIHWRVELAAAWIGAAAGLVAAGPQAAAGAAFGWWLLALAALDITAWWLPDRLTAPLAVAGLALGQGTLADRAIGGVGGFAVLWLVAAGYRRWRGREGLGGGDPKLLGAIGCWLGWAMLPAVLLVAGLIGLGWVAVLRLRGQAVAADTALPFGALMAAAAYLAWLAMVGAAA
jgi:leader peptidase (prepilin peptidase) / N-methyltransferase